MGKEFQKDLYSFGFSTTVMAVYIDFHLIVTSVNKSTRLSLISPRRKLTNQIAMYVCSVLTTLKAVLTRIGSL